MVEFGRGRESAERGGDAARQRHAEHRREKFRPVGHQHADARALADATGDQRPGDRIGLRPQIVMAPADHAIGPVEDQRLPPGMGLRDLTQPAAERQRAQALLISKRRASDDRERSHRLSG